MRIWVPGDPIPPEWEQFTFFDWITDTIAITCYERACDREILDIEGIEYVISIGDLSPSESVCGRRPVQFRNIQDATLDVSYHDITACVDAIRDRSHRGKTLVHCAAGVSRSPGHVALSLCLDNGWDWDQAKTYVMDHRSVVRIHPLLEQRLKGWLASRPR